MPIPYPQIREPEEGFIYAKFIGPTLNERVKILHQRKLSLEHELVLQRAIFVDAVECYNRTVEQVLSDTQISPERRIACLAAAGDFISTGIARIRDLAIAEHKLQRDPNVMVSPIQLQYEIQRVIRQVDITINEHSPRMRQNGYDPQPLLQDLTKQLTDLGIGLEEGSVQDQSDIRAAMSRLYPADVEAQAMDDTIPLYKSG